MKSNHTLSGVSLTLRLHHACIGVIKPDHDHTCPIPGKTVIKQTNSKIIRFIISTTPNYRNLEEMIESNHGKLEEIELSKSNICDIIVNCTLKRNMEDFVQKAKVWKSRIHVMCAEFLDDYTLKDMDIVGDNWDEFIEETALIPCANDDREVKLDTLAHKISAVGKKSNIQPLIEHLKQVCM